MNKGVLEIQDIFDEQSSNAARMVACKSES